ncbi:MAG: hypothetical protein IJM85_06160 [Clostridia bacterium]|nr:hypothetical protein [Clostridia bacterium]
MELDIKEAREYIVNQFRKQGDFDFIKPADFDAMVDKLLELDAAYLEEIGDEPYDEDVIYDRFYAALNEQQPALKTYLMRFVDDYMDFMEQYLVSVDAIEWE